MLKIALIAATALGVSTVVTSASAQSSAGSQFETLYKVKRNVGETRRISTSSGKREASAPTASQPRPKPSTVRTADRPRGTAVAVAKPEPLPSCDQLEFVAPVGASVGEPLRFVVNKAELRRSERPRLLRIAHLMNCETSATVRFRLEGHTDSTGSDSYNEWLSRKRAETVFRELVKYGVESSRLEFVGFGETRPRADLGASTHPDNRRVEFVVLSRS